MTDTTNRYMMSATTDQYKTAEDFLTQLHGKFADAVGIASVVNPENVATLMALLEKAEATGYDNGYNAGDDRGYMIGEEMGYNIGYEDGRAEGVAAAKTA